jgi:hypothetical protein
MGSTSSVSESLFSLSLLVYHDIMIQYTSKPARKPRVTDTPVLVRLQPDQLKAIDTWRREQDTLPSRAEAIRRLAAGQFSKRGR